MGGCRSSNPDGVTEPVETGATTQVERVPTETAAFTEEAIAPKDSSTLAPEETLPLRPIAPSESISDPGDLMAEYMAEGVFISHFDAADIAFHDDASGHKEAVGFLIGFGKFTPGQEVAGAADGAPILVKGSNCQQIRNIDVFNEILGFFGDVQKFGNAIRFKISDTGHTANHK